MRTRTIAGVDISDVDILLINAIQYPEPMLRDISCAARSALQLSICKRPYSFPLNARQHPNDELNGRLADCASLSLPFSLSILGHRFSHMKNGSRILSSSAIEGVVGSGLPNPQYHHLHKHPSDGKAAEAPGAVWFEVVGQWPMDVTWAAHSLWTLQRVVIDEQYPLDELNDDNDNGRAGRCNRVEGMQASGVAAQPSHLQAPEEGREGSREGNDCGAIDKDHDFEVCFLQDIGS